MSSHELDASHPPPTEYDKMGLALDNTIAKENGYPEDWEELPKFKRGDKVKILRPLTDEETESYGYPEEMATCVGTAGTVLSHRFGNYEVACPCLQCGPYYEWPEGALELATDDKPLPEEVRMGTPINLFAWTETVCPIAALPEAERKLVLWNMTCWPFDLATACEQLSEIARKLNAGISIGEQWAKTEADIERVMAQYEEAHEKNWGR